MITRIVSLVLLVSAFLSSCKLSENEPEIQEDPKPDGVLVEILEQKYFPLTINPLAWSDNELSFIEEIASKKIIGLGEATHGTAEFFRSKHRIFQYLVENHGFKIFAFEADFGESLFINEAVQKSDKAAIESLMKDKMHFWTWKTEEVKDLLIWMCDYNLGKPDEDKVQYMGVDCQYNTFHPDLLKVYLEETDASFVEFANEVLTLAKTASQNNFQGYTGQAFNNYLAQLDELQEMMLTHKQVLINKSSIKDFELNLQMLDLVKQVSEVRYRLNTHPTLRDNYMAQNTAWLLDYFDGQKIVIWAHNAHVAKNPNYGGGRSQGSHLQQMFGAEYAVVAFLFSKGTFTAFRPGSGVGVQSLLTEPWVNSLNGIMSGTEEKVFSVKMLDLQNSVPWVEAFNQGLPYFQIGSTFSNNIESFYHNLNRNLYDYIIYFDNTNHSVLLN